MSSYRVVTAFTAFQRDYKRDEILTDADLECWQPETDRAAVVESLVRQGKIEPLAAGAAGTAYPATWGADKPPADTAS